LGTVNFYLPSEAHQSEVKAGLTIGTNAFEGDGLPVIAVLVF
jgi:hypothetical protein